MKLAGRAAVITGASQGLGREIARRFVVEGASVAICARDGGLLDEVSRELRELAGAGQKVCAMTCDVSAEDQVGAFVRFCLAELDTVQALVTNAGVLGPKGSMETVDVLAWTRTVEINLFGVVFPCRALIPHFRAAKYGKIVVLSGGGATAPLPFMSAYAASKAAVVRLAETLAAEVRDTGIDVNAVAPGVMNTRMLREALDAGPESVGAEYHAKMLVQAQGGAATPDKAASLCAFLASADSDGITGRLISAQWDPWETLSERREELAGSDIYTLRRIVPEDRGKRWE